MAEGLSLMLQRSMIGMGAVGGRSQLRLGGLDFSGLSVHLEPAMAATVSVGEAREVAAAQAEVVRRILLVSLCQVSSGVVPSKGHRGRQVSLRRRHCWPRWIVGRRRAYKWHATCRMQLYPLLTLLARSALESKRCNTATHELKTLEYHLGRPQPT